MSSHNRTVIFGIAAVGAIALVILFRPPNPESPGPVAGSTAATPAASQKVTPTPDADEEIETLKKQLARERAARQRAEAELAALRNKPVPQPLTNVVVLPRKVEEVGKQAGAFLPVMAELTALSRRDPGTLSAEEKRRLLQLQRDHAKLLGALPEITAYQDNPEQYGKFFRSMVQEAAGLSEPQAAQVEEYMTQRATMMNGLGLNAGKEPTDPKLEEDWEARRDTFNAQTAEGLKAVLPPNVADRAGLSAELLEFLEMDFDKVTPQSIAQRQQE
jgi:hypothetical protein